MWWRFEGEEVPRQGEAIYLGTRFDAAQGMEGAWLKLLGKARGAMHGAWRRCGVLGVGAAGLQLHLFEALVRPVMDFGAAVWGRVVSQAGGVKEAEDLCLQLLRLTFGVTVRMLEASQPCVTVVFLNRFVRPSS